MSRFAGPSERGGDRQRQVLRARGRAGAGRRAVPLGRWADRAGLALPGGGEGGQGLAAAGPGGQRARDVGPALRASGRFTCLGELCFEVGFLGAKWHSAGARCPQLALSQPCGG